MVKPGRGVVLWYRPPGYHHYQLLNLLGIWARGENDQIQIIVGTRALTYQGNYYNPESYFHHIRRTYETYYGKDASPPGGSGQLYTVIYDPARRLEIRRELDSTLAQWAQTHTQV